MRALAWDQVRARRLERHFLDARAGPERIVEVVSAVCGIHAQVTAAAELSLAARVAGVTRETVRDELWRRRRLVKTWSLRGTLHLHPADELPLWMAARRAVTGWRDGRWHEEEGLERARAEAVLEAIGEALDGRCLLREELADEVARRVGPWAEEPLRSGWAYLLGPAVATGLLCHGPPRGSKVTFVRADQWLGRWEDPDLEEALREVLRRYLLAYGPVAPSDFREWFTSRLFKAADARALFESLEGELEEVDVEGRRTWLLRAAAELPGGSGGGSVRLLPEYDCYVLGFREREHLLPEAARRRLADHPRGRYEGPAAVPWLLVDGAVAGMWERRRRGRRIEVQVRPVGRLGSSQRRLLEEEADRLGAFLDLPVELSVAAPG